MHHPIAGVVNHVIDVVDVDGVIRRIDVNDVIERIDVNKVVSRIDWNHVLSTIDWNTQLERIDFDKILQTIDTNSIIARSSTGIVSTVLDTLRTQVILLDLYLMIVISRCKKLVLWKQQEPQQQQQQQHSYYLPPKPSTIHHRQRDDQVVYPKGRTNKAIAVQGRYCGFMSKAIAILLDTLTITILFAFMFQVIQWCFIVFLRNSHDEATQKTQQIFQRKDEDKNVSMLIVYCMYWFGYFFLTVGLIGQTFGMMIVGLKVCNCTKSTITPYTTISLYQAFLRTCLLPVTLTLCPPLGSIGFVRRDGRMVHDLIANTGIIYLWDAKLAKLRQKVMQLEEGRQEGNGGYSSVTTDMDGTDELDHFIGNDNENYQGNDNSGNAVSFQGQEVLLGHENQVVNRNNNAEGGASSSLTLDYATFPPAHQNNDTRRNRPNCCPVL